MGMTRHQYLLKTDRVYREQVITETILKMAQVIEVLAYREGISWDADGNIEGLNDDEQKVLASKIPAVELNQVKDFAPSHRNIVQEVAALDAYANVPDPTIETGQSEKVDESNPEQGSYLVNKIGSVPLPTADAELDPDQEQKFADGGFFPEDGPITPAETVQSPGATPVEGSQEEGAVEESDDPNETSGDAGDDGDDQAGDDGMTPKERLKARAEELGLDTSGTKADLEARISEAESK